MRRIIAIPLLCLLYINTNISHAHDFWLSPINYHAKNAPADIPVKFLVGHTGHVSAWSLGWDKVVALRTYSDSHYQDQLANLVVNTDMVNGFVNVALATQGTHVLGFESYHSLSSLEAEKFNDYTEKEGLALILKERDRLQQTHKEGTEIYSRKAKTLLQVGNTHTDNVTSPIGHMLEIVPLRNPYQLNNDTSLPFRVMFRGKPLPNALVDIAPLSGSIMKKQAMRTNAKGEISFNIEMQGSWIVNVIWGVPNGNQGKAEFETYFASLTFGYEKQ